MGAEVEYIPNLNIETANGYEEGTWTPTIVYSTSQDTSHTIQVGTYIKVGKLVTIQCRLRWNVTASSGTMSVAGMPFTHSTTTNTNDVAAVYPQALVSTVGGIIAVYGSNNVLGLLDTNVGAAANLTSSNDATSGNTITFTMTYTASA